MQLGQHSAHVIPISRVHSNEREKKFWFLASTAISLTINPSDKQRLCVSCCDPFNLFDISL